MWEVLRMKRNDKFSALYKINIRLYSNNHNISINIPKSDIVSISIINNYDTMTFPIVRFRLYSDISVIQSISEYPNDFYICGNFDGGIYRMNDDEKSPIMIKPIKSQSFQLKMYIENKNIPSSKMDNYIDGEKKDDFLNNDIKVPIEVYGYNEKLIHLMKQKVQSIYKDMSLLSVIEDIFHRNNITSYQIDPLFNQNKYNQILIPDLNISQALSFFESRYGLYKKGGCIFGDIDKIYICDTNVNNNIKPLPIYVDSPKNTNDMSGMKRTNTDYFMETTAKGVSIISETDIEKTLNSPNLTSINVNDLTVKSNLMQNLYAEEAGDVDKMMISTPNILHKTLNQCVNDMYIARIDEKITKVDVSGVGFDVWKLKINTRYNLIFESAMRGVKMNQCYRARYMCHTFTNLDSDLFIAQTTMNLCSN